MKVTAVLCLLAVLAAPALAKRSILQADAPAPSSGITDVDILNFALNLEYLEAEFYSCAASGSPLPDELRGGGPPSTGCEKAQLTPTAQAYADEIAMDEINHVRFLRSGLGAAAVPIPQLDIGAAFAAAANAAVMEELSPPFSPYLNDLFFYHGAFIFEDVGVTAYLGAAGLIQSTEYLSDAAKILAVEAYHAGIIRTLLYQQRDVETPYNVTVTDLVQAISALRASAGGGADQGIVIDTANGVEANLVPADSETSLAFSRTPTEVLDIVTLGSGASGGGFFPEGLNGVSALTSAPAS